MAWRIVKQPNGKYARFADPVDNFTHYDMTREEAVEYCQDEIGLKAGETKVVRAEEEPGRWADSLETIELIHGLEERLKVEALITMSMVPPNPNMPTKRVFIAFKIEPESGYEDQVVSALDTLAHSDLRLDMITGGIELRRSHYERLERTMQDD